MLDNEIAAKEFELIKLINEEENYKIKKNPISIKIDKINFELEKVNKELNAISATKKLVETNLNVELVKIKEEDFFLLPRDLLERFLDWVINFQDKSQIIILNEIENKKIFLEFFVEDNIFRITIFDEHLKNIFDEIFYKWIEQNFWIDCISNNYFVLIIVEKIEFVRKMELKYTNKYNIYEFVFSQKYFDLFIKNLSKTNLSKFELNNQIYKSLINHNFETVYFNSLKHYTKIVYGSVVKKIFFESNNKSNLKIFAILLKINKNGKINGFFCPKTLFENNVYLFKYNKIDVKNLIIKNTFKNYKRFINNNSIYLVFYIN